MNRLTAKESLSIRYGLFNDEERKSLGYPTSDEIYNKLKEYEDAEEQGCLIKLPCKVGDRVYQIKPSSREHYAIIEWSIRYFECYANEIHFCDFPYIHFAFANDIGKTVFFTRKEAEVALEKMKDSESELV